MRRVTALSALAVLVMAAALSTTPVTANTATCTLNGNQVPCPPNSFQCSVNNATVPCQWEYRLVGPNTTTLAANAPYFYGRLEARQQRDRQFSYVCHTGFTTATAEVACRSLGYTGGSALFRAAEPQERHVSQASALTGLECFGNETSLEQCVSRGSGCANYSAAIVACGDLTGVSSIPSFEPARASAARWEYRLVGGVASTYGRLEVRPNSSAAWGTYSACSPKYGAGTAAVGFREAIAACRGLGLDVSAYDARVARFANETGASTQPIWVMDANCDSPPLVEQPLEQCRSTESYASCTHAADVWVTCGTNLFPGETPRPTVPHVDNAAGPVGALAGAAVAAMVSLVFLA
eukprot:CAMPEP_0174851100 /NCGR_PEP_ID=MMETSP1114-20130205/21617_1 /TAXON_ID=312471 /ORGANISM="Neobodo designis, Strain CCAP 1951/1" /LENGTH=350 /DNA_ID=CAMNT_0016085609 /DNA_START=60 /DNA_END=1112 /DNA_ORIENTATION=+